MVVWSPSDADVNALVAEATTKAGKDKSLADNFLFSSLFHHEKGLYPREKRTSYWEVRDGEWKRLVRGLTRRQWGEYNFWVRPKRGSICRAVFQPAQRKLEVHVLRMERAGVPVRIIILKARQVMISTYVQIAASDLLLRGNDRRATIIANNEETAEKLLRIATIAKEHMQKGADGSCYEFAMRSRAAYALVYNKPIDASLTITSANQEAAGRGDTIDFLHITETAFWPDAADRAVGALESVPDLPGTYAFNESTANGAAGWFYAEWQTAWENRHKPYDRRATPWDPMFFAWYEHPDYRWSKTMGRPLPKELEAEIMGSLDEEERWLLRQRFIRRWTPEDEWERVSSRRNGPPVWRRKGVGWRNVDVDQLAWRRRKIAGYKGKGGENTFNAEYPSRQEVAFLATGSRVFDPKTLEEYSRRCVEPIWTGELIPTLAATMLPPAQTSDWLDEVLNKG